MPHLTYRRYTKIFRKFGVQRSIVMGAVVAVGLVTLAITHAASSSFSFMGNATTVTGNASIVSDPNAGGGSYLKFGSTSGGGGGGGSGTLLPVRGFTENSDGSRDSLFHQLGFTAANSPASTSGLDNAAANGMKGMVWVGDYNNSTCQFDVSDTTITSDVNAVKSHPALLGYFVADEPEQAEANCPNVAAQLKARSDLIKSLDPNHFTFAIISNEGTNMKCYDYATFMGSVDVMGLDIYPFRQDASYMPCVSDPTHPLTDISQAIAAFKSQGATYQASHPGFVPRFYGVLQDFQDTIWRRPTVTELQQQFAAWQGSGMEGLWYFSWDWQGNSLDGNTAHECEFKIENQVVSSC